MEKKFKLNIDNDFFMNNQIYLNPDSFILNNFDVKQDYFNIKEQIEYNLNIPSNNEFKFLEKSENNYNLFYEILKHLNIKINRVKEINIERDGNCFFNIIYNLTYLILIFKYFSFNNSLHIILHKILYKLYILENNYIIL